MLKSIIYDWQNDANDKIEGGFLFIFLLSAMESITIFNFKYSTASLFEYQNQYKVPPNPLINDIKSNSWFEN